MQSAEDKLGIRISSEFIVQRTEDKLGIRISSEFIVQRTEFLTLHLRCSIAAEGKVCQIIPLQSMDPYVLSKQLLRSGTSIGANVAEAQRGQSKPDFISKMNIALKEANDTDFWLRLLNRTGYITDLQFNDLKSDIEEIISILTAIVKKAKFNMAAKS